MIWKVCLSFCLLLISSQCGEPLSCGQKEQAKTKMMRLKLDLLCGYDKYLRPVAHHSNKTVVRLKMAPRTIEFDEYGTTLRVKTWLSTNWKDYQLAWDTVQYDNIDHIVLDTSMIWTPDLSVYNTKEESDTFLDQIMAPVIVAHYGQVWSFMTPVLQGHCVPDWTRWPFDIHECTLTLRSKRYGGNILDFHFMNKKKGISLKHLLPSREWELVKTNVTRNETQLGPKNETDSLYLVSLNYQFTLRRHATVYVATYLMPGVVLILMSLCSLWIPPHRTQRVILLCTVMIIQSLTLQFLSYTIHTNGDTTPYIVCFYRDTMIFSGLLIALTVVSRALTSCPSNPPFLQTIARLVASHRLLQLILLSDIDPKNAAKLMDTESEEGSILVSTDDNSQQWQMFVKIIDRVCFILLILVYFHLSVSLMPINY